MIQKTQETLAAISGDARVSASHEGTDMQQTTAMRTWGAASVATKRAALMARVSTSEQTQGYGITVQLDAGSNYINGQPGWTLNPDHIFVDEGVSGSIIDRPEMLRLEAAARQRLIDVIVVHKFDRIGRTGRAFWAWIWAMEDLGIRFVSVTQNIDTTTDFGRQQLQFYAMMAEAEWNAIRTRTVDGRNAAVLAGKWAGGPAPYGFQIQGDRRNKTLVHKDDEIKVILKAVNLIVDEGMNCGEASRELNRLHYFTRQGKKWTGPNLLQRMKTQMLIGQFIYRDPSKPGKGGKGRTRLNVDGTPMYGDSVTLQFPEIITLERFTLLQAALSVNAHGPRENTHTYPLSGRIPSACGRHYIGQHDKATMTRYYMCMGKRQQPEDYCQCKGLNAQDIEQAVWKDIAGFLGDRERLAAMANDWLRTLPGDIDKHRERVALLEKSVADGQEKLTMAAINLATLDQLDDATKKAALAKLNENLREDRESLVEAQAVLEEQERAAAEAQSMLAAIENAKINLTDLGLTEMRDMMAILNIRVEILGEIPGNLRAGRRCMTSDWHAETGTLVPDDVSEEEWPGLFAAINANRKAAIFARKGTDLRQQINGILYRLRTRCSWSGVPAHYGTATALKARSERLWSDGDWRVIVDFLNARGGGTEVPPERSVPEFKVHGVLMKEVAAAPLVGAEASSDSFVRQGNGNNHHSPRSGLPFTLEHSS